MMAYYDNDGGRRCRRCKRRRLDDEPPEVRQYKTCAKCRIIERQKKKSKKPLTEETINYGMRQMQEQSPNGWAEEFFNDNEDMDESISKRIRRPLTNSATGTASGTPSNYPLKTVDNFSNPNSKANELFTQPSTVTQDQLHQKFNSNISSTTSRNIHANNNTNNATGVTGNGGVSNSSTNNNSNSGNFNTAISSVEASNEPLKPSFCDLCSARLEIEVARLSYNLCKKCCLNPYRLDNVISDYNVFLESINFDKMNKSSMTFIKEIIVQDFNEVIETNANNERQFREMVFNTIKNIYLNPVIASTGSKFTRTSANISGSVHTAPIIDSYTGNYIYANTEQIQALYVAKNDNNEENHDPPQIFVSFSLATNIIIIKVQKFGKEVKNLSDKYPVKFINLIDRMLKTLISETNNTGINIGYNKETAHIIFDKLKDENLEYPQEIQQLINAFTKEEFAEEFVEFEHLLN